MTILVVDSNAKYSTGASYVRAFSALGQNVRLLNAGLFLGGYSRSLAVRIPRRIVKPLSKPAYNAYVLSEVVRARPDVLFVQKGSALWPSTIAAARRWVGVRAVFQNDDAMNPKSTTPDMLRALPLWDVVFTPRAFALGELRSAGARRVEYLPFAYDPHLSYRPPEGQLDHALASSVVFVGGGFPERIAPLEALARRVPLVVFGYGWERVRDSSPLRPGLRPAAFGDRLRVINASAAINVAFVAKVNRDQHTMRTFEIPASGGFMLAERTDTHAEIFREDEEAAFFGSTEELMAKAVRYLSDLPARQRIAAAGYRRVTGRERYEDRAEHVLEVVRHILRVA